MNSANEYSPLLMVIVTVIGLLFVILQLKEFGKQNETLNSQSELLRKTLIQSFRPIGYINQINIGAPKLRVIDYPPSGRNDKFSFVYKQHLVNEGAGVLVNIGHLYYLTKERVNFREGFLSGDYDSTEIRFDGRIDNSRRQTLLPKDTNEVIIAYHNIEFAEKYNIYLLHFYEDQDGNLYDTEVDINFDFEPPHIKNDRLFAELKSVFTNNIYHAYTETEKSNLVNIIKKYNHPLWKYFTIKE